ncbi:hypothetical protein GGH94_001592 [Coemansia aciculifera]|uniref:RanBP2-type domain-containing protein n=1 Tax=Coemansia aciculifera TaxID=417176 RepID=A0A9W8IKQ1_9FUNG|nr:hypothetical protein GGH94_001592 [Coemansia aciculifera]
MPPLAMVSVAEITKYVEREAQAVDIVHSHVNDNTCLRISDQPFSANRRDTPAYVKLLAISNTYGYIVAGTPTGLSVFTTSDAEAELAKGESRGTNTAVSLSARKEIDLSRFGQPTHVGISADELQVLVATISGKILVFSAASLLHSSGDTAPIISIAVGKEIRDMRANPQELPTAVAVLTLDGDVFIADLAEGSLKKIVSSGGTPITAICWSRKGKQIVCGDTNATLTQRLPTDGTIKRTIKPQVDDGGIADGSAILAVDWIDTYTFFAVYGLTPDGTFTPGSGGGGNGSNDEDDGFEHNMTSAYVITQASKLAPMQWLCVEDPCSSMMCPTRYPGFHIASISDWGTSAQNILIMAGTSSDATMTIGQARGTDSSPELEWAMWDIDGAMAVMPLSAIATDFNDSADTYPIGMAVDYTCKRDLPPVLDDGDRVKPVPVLWVLNTDACLLGYHIYNTYEMKRGTRCPLMVDQVKPLPGAAKSESTLTQAVVEPAKTTPFGSAKAFGSAAGSGSTGAFGALAKPSSFTSGLFGSSSGSTAFGMSGTITPIVKPPTTLGVTGQHVFGSTSKSSAATPAFGGFGGTALSAGKSIFDAPASDSSIFGTGDKAKTASPFGGFGSTALSAGKSIFDAPASGSSIFDGNDKAKTASPFGVAPTIGLPGPSKSTTAQPLLAPSGFGKSQVKDLSAKPSDNTPAPVSFGSAPKPSFGLSMGSPTSNLFDSVKKPLPSFVPATNTKLADKERLENEKRKEDEKRKDDEKRKEVARAQEAARALELERRNEQARLDALEREREERTQALIDQQYIATCNSFDRDLKALAASVKDTESAIACARSACLPPIPLNTTVQSVAAMAGNAKPLTIEDSKSWINIADVLLEALHVSHDELRASQKSVNKQMSGFLKTETKRDEISRILDSATSTMPLPNATTGGGGLNSLLRDSQRRLKSTFAQIRNRSADVEQVVRAKASPVESTVNDLPLSRQGSNVDSVQRMLLNVTQTLHQRNLDLEKLAKLVDDMAIGGSVEHSHRRESKAPLPPAPATSLLARRGSRTQSTGGVDPGSLRTAAAGIPWSPDALPLNTSSFGRREGGFGLSSEDLVAHDGSVDMVPVAPQQSLGYPRQSTISSLPGKPNAIGTNPNFPNSLVRELVPRSSKVNRKASLVLDGESAALGQEISDDASLAPTSALSGAAASLQARKQRSMVRDALTHSARTAALIHSPELTATRAYKLGSLSSSIVAEPVPMPNLERYVQAFGKLKLAEPAPSPKPEPEAQKTPPVPAFGSVAPPTESTSSSGRELAEWQCSICDLKSPDSAVACIVCEHPRPGIQPAPPTSLFKASMPPPATFSGFKPSGGLSLTHLAAAAPEPSSSSTSAPFGAPILSFSSGGLSLTSLAAAPEPSSSSTFAPFGAPILSFSSFAPPTSANTEPTATPTPAFSGFRPSGGFSLTQSSAPSSGPGLSFGTATRQAPLFGAFVPPSGMAPLVSTAASTNFGTSPVTSQETIPIPASEEGEQWICDDCELKSPAHATVCIVCEAPRPSARAAIQAADLNAGDDSSAEADVGSFDDHLSAPGDSDASEDSGAEDGYSEDEDEGAHSDGSVEDPESNLASDEELERELDAAKMDVEANSGDILEFGLDAGDMSGTNPASHPVLSYADAAKVALADHGGEEPALEDNTTPAPDHLDDIGQAPADTGNGEAPTELEPVTPGSVQLGEHDQEHDHDHDSDGFVHVSQQEPELQSQAGVSQDDGDDVLSVLASETSLDTPTDMAPSTGEHVSDMASDLDDISQDPSETSDTESKILAAVSDELDRGIPEDHTPVLEEPQQSIEPVTGSESELSSQHPLLDAHLAHFLSGVSIAQVVDQALGCHASTPEPAVVVLEEPDSVAAVNDGAVAPESTKADAESEVEVAEEAQTLQSLAVLPSGDSDATPSPATDADSTSPLQVIAEQQDEAAPAFALDDLATGIESALGDMNTAEDDSSAPLQPTVASNISAPERVIEQAPADNVAATPTQLPATSESGAKSFFKAGRLGSFGNQLGKSTTATSGQAVSASSSSALPNAFSAAATTSTPAFGAKLDRPAFGVASMSSFGATSQSGQQQSTANSSGGSANMGKIGAGFSSRASASIDPFAAYKGTSNFWGTPADDAATGSSGKPSLQPTLSNSSAHMPGDNSSPRHTPKTSSKPAALQPSAKDVDPILSIIHGSDSEADKDDLDTNYDSD